MQEAELIGAFYFAANRLDMRVLVSNLASFTVKATGTSGSLLVWLWDSQSLLSQINQLIIKSKLPLGGDTREENIPFFSLAAF